MSPSRFFMVAVVALGASSLSFGPRLPAAGGSRGATEPAGAAVVVAEAPALVEEKLAEVAWPPVGVRAVSAPVPGDVKLEVEPRADGGLRVQVTRRGALVALRHRGASAAGRDWAALELRPLPGAAAPDRDALVWESTDAAKLTTTRGLVLLEQGAGGTRGTHATPEARLALAEAPARGPSLRDEARTHECAAHEDGAGGFVVICRLGQEARAPRAVNVAGARPLEGAWMMEAGGRGGGSLARLELPRGAGFAEARALAYVRGLTAVVLRAEAVWRPGGAPTLLLDEARRVQPSVDAGETGWR